MRMFSRITLAAAALSLSLATGPAAAEVLHVVTSQGAREAIVLPVQRAPAPTVIVLHGATATAERTAQASGFAEAAAAQGFVSVFPQGINRQWNDGREGHTSAVDDVGFLRRLVDELVRRGVADPARIYLAGISNGGMMTFRMLCDSAELFAGAATIIANMPAGIGERCTLRQPMRTVMFNGTADPLVPYAGGVVGFAGKRGLVWGAERTAEFVAHANQCAGAETAPLPAQSSTASVHVTRLAWTSCRSGESVTLYRLEGGGHQVPGRPTLFPRLLGLSTQDIRAAETALAFLAR
jgi:polyhydroxybutyrate depolymerase